MTETTRLLEKMEAMLERMAAMQVELDGLKAQRPSAPSTPEPGTAARATGTGRRQMLRRLAGGMVAGLAVGTVAAVVPENAQARMIVDPVASDSSRRIGAIVVPTGTARPTGIPNGAATVKYGLVATDGSVSPFDLASLPGDSTGVYGSGDNTGVYGSGTGVFSTGVYGSGLYGVQGTGIGSASTGVYGSGNTGVYGNGTYGVYGNGSNSGVQGTGTNSNGVKGTGTTYGVYGTGTGTGTTYGVYGDGDIGVRGSGSSFGLRGTSNNIGVSGEGGSYGMYGQGIIGVKAYSSTGGISSPALRADHNSATGIAAILNNSSSDTTLLINNAGAGPLLKAWANGVPKIEFTIGGLIKANGGFQTGGADLAEFIPIAAGDAEPALEAGEVVEIDPQQPGLFRRCATAGSLAVAGVISTRPGMMLGASNPTEAENLGPQLALAGRIPVKVCGEGGAIQPGDLLEAASVAGHARRASSPSRPGSILGKALGSLQEGTGIVEMLVMLG